ncbi:hypothetical protein HK097_005383 [Rhizophlyctis rosea]|uniref:Uncharacterized protein n=1 Tax=Rhizophlyctis rosea TaxID=64517 RepID=A0AAD5SLA1_9FUNG|nr:hypothetical protein HK097_005383 [Rhizophlyctis rosea]
MLLLARRYGKNAVPKETGDDSIYLNEYKNLSVDGTYIPADKLQITWSNGHYWKIEDNDSALSTKIAVLSSVCWFDVVGEIRGVRRGKYRPVARIRFERDAFGLEGVQLSAAVIEKSDEPSVDPTEVAKSTVTFPQDYQSMRAAWKLFRMPILQVGTEPGAAEYHTVRISAVDHGTGWKAGLSIDYVGLETVEERKVRRSGVEGGDTVDSDDSDDDDNQARLGNSGGDDDAEGGAGSWTGGIVGAARRFLNI